MLKYLQTLASHIGQPLACFDKVSSSHAETTAVSIPFPSKDVGKSFPLDMSSFSIDHIPQVVLLFEAVQNSRNWL